MSKMSQLHAELTEQAIELGFENLEEALANGYEVDYEEQKLVNPYVLSNKAHEEAHEAWLKEREEVLTDLILTYNYASMSDKDREHIGRAIEFIKKGEV